MRHTPCLGQKEPGEKLYVNLGTKEDLART